jgi:hypothetical protein
MICEFSDRMTQINKFKDLNSRFVILETEMTKPNKFEHLKWTLFFLQLSMSRVMNHVVVLEAASHAFI